MAILHISTRRCELTLQDQQTLQRYVDKLQRQLPDTAPDEVAVTVLVERQTHRDVYEGSVRVAVHDTLLPAKCNSAPAIRVLLKRAFEDIEDQLERLKPEPHSRKAAS